MEIFDYHLWIVRLLQHREDFENDNGLQKGEHCLTVVFFFNLHSFT